jgi:hypothetical protein
MDAILERMNAMLADQGKAADKENIQPANANLGMGTGRAAGKKKRCPHCRKHVFHTATDCYELEANASKRWTGWKLVKDTKVTAAWQGPGTNNNNNLLVADTLVKTSATTNKN